MTTRPGCHQEKAARGTLNECGDISPVDSNGCADPSPGPLVLGCIRHPSPLVTGDRVQFQQVILNLLRNASDAMSTIDDRSRDLLIRTEPDDNDRVRLSVRDVGIGFEPRATDKLFEAFYTTKNEGMGIGLSVSRSIIEHHHGRLWAMPNSDPGVTFSFSIPCRPEGLTSDGARARRIHEAHSYDMELRQERRATERPLVSVVDDDESVRESLPDLLRRIRLCSPCILIRGRGSTCSSHSVLLRTFHSADTGCFVCAECIKTES